MQRKMKWSDPGLILLVSPASGWCKAGYSAYIGTGSGGTPCINTGHLAAQCDTQGMSANAQGKCENGPNVILIQTKPVTGAVAYDANSSCIDGFSVAP